MTRENSKSRMLDAAASLLKRQGYHGTGLNQILRESGAPKGSLYFHFPGGKQELAAAALERAGVAFHERLERAIERAPGFERAIQSVCGMLAHELVESGFTYGCPLATVALESAATSDRIRDACVRQYGSWEHLFRDKLVAQGLEPEHASATATLVLSAIEGALLLSRTYRDTAPLALVGAAFKAILAPLIKPGPTGA